VGGMKTNRSARWLIKVRGIAICFALVGMVGVAFWSGKALAARFARASVAQSEFPPLPHASLADLMAAAQ
jgi:hypothetical protein